MSEYYLNYTGAQLDDAINKVRSGYILPTEIINIVENVSNMDISKGKTLNVNVPQGYTKYNNGIYSPPSNVYMPDFSLNVGFKPKVFVIFANAGINSSSKDNNNQPITFSFVAYDASFNKIEARSHRLYYNSSYYMISPTGSAGHTLSSSDTGVVGGSTRYFYFFGNHAYNWYAWG